MGKKVAIPFVSLLVLLILGFGAYSYLHSPKYTLKAIGDAISDHDWNKFQKYVDVDAIANSMISKATSKTDNSLAQGIANVVSGNIKEAFVSKLKSEIENPKNENSGGIFKQFLGSDTTIKKIESENKGKVNVTRIHSKYGIYQVPAYLEITMRSEGMRFVVIDINTDIVESRTSAVEQLHKQFVMVPIRKKIAESVKIEVTKKYKGCANSLFGNCYEDLIMIQRRIENLTDKAIAKIEYSMYPSSIFTTSDYRKFDSHESIPPKGKINVGASQGWKYNQFKDEDKVWMYSEGSEIVFEPTKIVFSESDTLYLNEYAYLSQYDNLPSLQTLADFGKENSLPIADSLILWVKQ